VESEGVKAALGLEYKGVYALPIFSSRERARRYIRREIKVNEDRSEDFARVTGYKTEIDKSHYSPQRLAGLEEACEFATADGTTTC
jgi:hypothetical protein